MMNITSYILRQPPGSEIILHAGCDGRTHQLHASLLVQCLLLPWTNVSPAVPKHQTKWTGLNLIARFKNRHCGQRTRTHCDIRKLVHRSVRMNSEERRTGAIDSANDKCSADVSLIPVYTPSEKSSHRNSERHKQWNNKFPQLLDVVNLKRYCASIVTAVATRHSRPVFNRWSVKFELIISGKWNIEISSKSAWTFQK